ncbi:hypothetical protein ACFSKN_18620 [Mariniflexile gromovii]|uniref:HD domain-containing protein n=1 Tax=Mariniflexile gromovii TaxID=362523 RepID=A0ABS4BUN4_9FLAO|nr:hypothetical protein [Mariniflexile gromovii]MBP0904298.1 hypothetical protein [Mariniflexile gromovii]
MDDILEYYRPYLLIDFDKYKNHVYRVYLNCVQMDKNADNHQRYALASVFHDIGIWTNRTFDYLEPSIEAVLSFMELNTPFITPEEICLMINNHHKVTPYHGIYGITVETFRKADWMDLTFYLLHSSRNRKELRKKLKFYPYLGFHRLLLKMALKHSIRFPWKPLPMLRI